MSLCKNFGAAAASVLLASTLMLAGCSTPAPQDTDASNSNETPQTETTKTNDSTQADATANDSSAEATSAGAVTFTDALGNEVTVENPQRVVACMGSFANIWELAGGTLVGASDDAFDTYAISSPDVAMVGDFAEPNLEAIIALEPDFVILTSGSGGRGGDSSQVELKEALDASGIANAYFNVSTFDDYLAMLKTLTDITGREDLYKQNGEDVAAAIEEIKASAAPGEAPTALVLTTFSGGTRVQSGSSQAGAMLADLGVVNLADENPSLLQDFSLESVIEMDPDFIFVVPMGNDTEAAMKNLTEATEANPAWATLSAVQNGRYITLDPEHFLYKPNEKWAESYQILYDALYGGEEGAQKSGE